MADGMAIGLWRLAQQYIKGGRASIPVEVMDQMPEAKSKLSKANLIKVEADGVYVCGSKEYLSWLEKRRVSGQKGGSSKSPLKTRSLKQYRSKTESSNSSSNSISNSISNSERFKSEVSLLPQKPENKTQTEKAKLERREILEHWLESYKQAKGEEYAEPRSAKTNSQIKSIHERLGVEKAKELLSAYLKINKGYYVERGHSLEVFQRDIPGVSSWAQNAAKNVADMKKFQITKDAIAEGATSLYERTKIYHATENLRHGGAIQQPLSSEAVRQVPESDHDVFDRELLTGTGSDPVSNSGF